MVSNVNSRGVPGRETAGGYAIHHDHSRQATLHTAFRFCAHTILLPRGQACRAHSLRTAIQVSSCTVGHPSICKDAIGVPRMQVSTAGGSVLHAIEARPRALTSSIHPKLGVRSKHQRLHRYALLRIFRPVLGTVCAD